MSTSRPELYDVGILDRRLSGEAFANIVGNGRRFHQVTEQIGQYRYAVGYAPVLDQNNSILAVVSVPTLYRQEEIDRDVSQRNAVLFGLYGLLLFGTLAIATALANRIAAPIHALTAATRRVAHGELDFEAPLPHAEGEIGELVRSFEGMTRDLKRNRDDLVTYERERAWKEMAQQVAHEIKNPLTPMKLSVQHLVQAFRDGAPNVRDVVEDVSRTLIEQIDALSRIASEFSRFARMPKPRPEDCDINAVLEDAVQLFEQEGVVDVGRILAPGLPVVHADREELRRAFINIIRNGVQAMNGKGRITVSTGRAPAGIRIEIRDEGAGMSEEVQARLFQPNFSTKTDGMGLGLAIVRKTVEDLQGTIRAVSAPGRGTTMIIEIPPRAHRQREGDDRSPCRPARRDGQSPRRVQHAHRRHQSRQPFGMNLSARVGDDPVCVEENRRRFFVTVGGRPDGACSAGTGSWQYGPFRWFRRDVSRVRRPCHNATRKW